jgi:hypothetical protein
MNNVASKARRGNLTGIDPAELGLAVLVHLGTPRAADHFAPGVDTVSCDHCGAALRHVFVTGGGHNLGGDCLATLCGDDSTRSSVARAARKANGVTGVRIFNGAVYGVRPGRAELVLRGRPSFVRPQDRRAAEVFGEALALTLGVPVVAAVTFA